MHQNALIIEILAKSLSKKLEGSRLINCFSSSKEDLYLVFDNDFVIHCVFQEGSCFFLFPSSEHLPQKNRLACFKEIHHQKLKEIIPHSLNRSFALEFGKSQVVFKLYGRNSNIIYLHKGESKAIFRDNLKSDLNLQNSDFQSNTIDTSITDPELFFREYHFIQKQFRSYFHEQSEDLSTTIPLFFERISKSKFGIVKTNKSYQFVLCDFDYQDELIAEYESILDAIHDFSKLYLSQQRFLGLKQMLFTDTQKQLKKTKKQLSNSEQSLSKINAQTPHYQIADIIMANLHQIEKGSTQVELSNFYTGEMETIKLKKDISAQKNAEKYYAKGKNSHKEKEKLEQSIENLTELQNFLEERLLDIGAGETYKDLKKFEKSQADFTEKKISMFRNFESDGFEIWVGKSSQNNEQLLRKAHKDDIWLHARGVSGSHVLIRKGQKGKIPLKTIEFAASLAAYYSKARNESLAEVVYTQRKYVRKFKGATAGKVMVEKEQVLLVKPYSRDL